MLRLFQLELPLFRRAAPPAEQTRHIQLGTRIVDYRLIRSSRRTLGMTIDQRGLRVGASPRTSHADIERFLRHNAAWVLKKLDEWLKSPETKKTHTPLRLASKLHFKLMQVFPYSRHMGKLARLMMNLVLLRSGYPPAIIHSTERQRYYESLKGPSLPLHTLMVESLENSIDSAIKRFSEARSGRRAMA